MTIHLPEEIESSIQSQVDDGRFASVDDAMAEAARLLIQSLNQVDQPTPSETATVDLGMNPGSSNGTKSEKIRKPIWEVFEEITASLPEDEWARSSAREADSTASDQIQPPSGASGSGAGFAAAVRSISNRSGERSKIRNEAPPVR